jgi:hypothetical protein
VPGHRLRERVGRLGGLARRDDTAAVRTHELDDPGRPQQAGADAPATGAEEGEQRGDDVLDDRAGKV